MHCIHCVYGVDRKDKLYYFYYVVLTRNFYISHISKHVQLSSRSGLDNIARKEHNLFSNNSTNVALICKFYIFYFPFFKIENL